MAAPYIPPRDVDLVDWADNFAALITASPPTYGLAAADAVIIQAAVDAYAAAYTLAVNPATRTPVTVADKNTARGAMLPIVRTYASQIRLNPGVSNPNKTALGLNLVNNVPSPIPAPSSSPILIFIGATPGQHTIRYADQNTPSSRSKPQGVIQLQLYLGVSTVTLNDPADTVLYAAVTKQPTAVNFSPADAGKVATYYSRWVTRRGLTGPWSAGISAIVPGV